MRKLVTLLFAAVLMLSLSSSRSLAQHKTSVPPSQSNSKGAKSVKGKTAKTQKQGTATTPKKGMATTPKKERAKTTQAPKK